MKTILTYILLILTLSSYSQDKYFLLPEGEENYIFEKVDDKLQSVNIIDLPITTLYEFFNANRLVSINQDTTELIFYSIDSLDFRVDSKILLPQDFKLHSLKIIDRYLLIGGDWNSGNSFYVFNYIESTWYKIPIPLDIYFPGKAIDDFLLVNDKIIAVDNIILPKYLIEYKISSLPELDNPVVTKIKAPGTYGFIRKGVANNDHLVLLSSTSGGYPRSCSDHVTILNSNDYTSGFYISSHKLKRWTYLNWRDIEIVDNQIFIACWEKGLGTIKIHKRLFWKIKTPWDNSKMRGLSKIRIRYRFNSPKRIVDIIKFSESKVIIVYIDKNKKYKTKIL